MDKKEAAMTEEAPANAPVAQRLRATRMPSLVADDLRRQILSGDLPDGYRLPKEENLRALFGVGRPVMREAMRVLEAEGLIVIVRGNQGGAVVRLPKPAHTSYAIGMILAAKNVHTGDVRTALRELEPACAALCAQRPDRATTTVPILAALHQRSLELIDDPEAVTVAFRRFHEAIAANCGNETLSVVVGALEQLWSSHVRSSVGRSKQSRPAKSFRQSYDDHQRILDCIVAGDRVGAHAAALGHIDIVQGRQTRANLDSPIDITTLRRNLAL